MACVLDVGYAASRPWDWALDNKINNDDEALSIELHSSTP